MIYEFKCRATGNVVMAQPVAERLLAIIGKSPGPTGIILPEQMPAAIAALEAAVAAERAQQAAASDEEDDENESRRAPAVTLAQRAWPMIDMLRSAADAKREVTWGV